MAEVTFPLNELDQTVSGKLQVINDFGPLSNAELLRRYGFVEIADNPHDCVEFSIEAVLQESFSDSAL